MCEGSKGKQRQQIPRKRAGKHCTANKVSGHLPVWLCYQLLAPNGQNIVVIFYYEVKTFNLKV